MFAGATSFNQDLDQWDITAVSHMSEIFAHTDSFNGNVNSWDTSSVRVFARAFFWASSFDQPLTNWAIGMNCIDFTDVFSLGVAALSECNKRLIYDGMLTASSSPTCSNHFDGQTTLWSDYVCPATFTNRAELVVAVDLYLQNSVSAYAEYGDITLWDVSQVTDMQACRFERLRQHAAHMHTPRPHPAPARRRDGDALTLTRLPVIRAGAASFAAWIPLVTALTGRRPAL
jgi:hypothetical protein